MSIPSCSSFPELEFLNNISTFEVFNFPLVRSFKMIIDFSSPGKNMFILPSGQSGHLISRHYDDQTSLWKSGDYLFLSGIRNVILGGLKGEIKIYPSSTK